MSEKTNTQKLFEKLFYERAILCVNAMQGILNPKAFVRAAENIRIVIDSLNPDSRERCKRWIKAFDAAKGKSK